MTTTIHKIVHPATLINPQNVWKIQNIDTRLKTFIELQAKMYTKPQVIPVVNIGVNGVGQGHAEFTGDGKLAYANALAYLATKNKLYAQNCVAILRSWATICRQFGGANAPVEAAWGVAALSRSCELLKYTFPQWDPTVERLFVDWVRRLLLPHLRGDTEQYKLNWGYFNNWHTSITEARLQYALLCNNIPEVNWCINRYRDIFLSYVRNNGVTGETFRDSDHCCFGLAGMIQTCELAYHQGVDLYSLRNGLLRDCIELHSGFYGCNIFPSFAPKSRMIVYKWIQPSAWEIAYNHYKNIKKRPMDNTRVLLTKIRPCKFELHWGYDTVTHYNVL